MSAHPDVLAVMDEMSRRFDATVPTPLGRPGESAMNIEHHIGLSDDMRKARAAVAELIAANRNCRPRLMHDDRQQEVVCIAPADWDRIRAALARVGGGA